jgi:hypothetical protein
MTTRSSMRPDFSLLARLWDELDRDPGWLAGECAAITAEIHRELEFSDELEVRELTYRSTEAILRLGLQLVHTATSPDDAEAPPAAVEYARELARRDIPIDTVLRAHQIGHRVFYERFAARTRTLLEDPVEIAEALELGALWTHALLAGQSRGVVVHYEEERDDWARRAGALRAEVVRALVAGEEPDEAAEARLGYTLGGHHIGFVVWTAGGDATDVEASASNLAVQLGEGRPLLHGLPGGALAGWVHARRVMDLSNSTALAPGVAAAVGTRRPGPAGFAETHREALAARRVAELRGPSGGTVTAYEDVALESITIGDPDRARAFVAGQLGPLASNDDGWARLALTLRCYLEHNARLRPTALALGVHENTVKNRIQAASELLGAPVEPRVAEVLVALRLLPLVRVADD